MPELPDPTDETVRLIKHRLLDFLAVWDAETGDFSPEAQALLLQELSELGAIVLQYDDEDPNQTKTVNFTPLMSATFGLLELLVGYTAAEAGVDRLAIVSSLRSVIDAPDDED